MRKILWSLAIAGALPLCTAANEGMWTFNNFPIERVNSAYETDIDEAWLDRIRQATIRLSNCTASLVSPDGLILTNHHCVASCLAEHSTRTSSLLETGFIASRRDEELRCGTQIADILVAMRDVTDEVQDALIGLDAQAANDARKAKLTTLEADCENEAQQRNRGQLRKCQAVTLYDGGQYFIYEYRRYDDVRLVFAPETAIAAFGGDPDNFQFPRWCLDMAFLRAYDSDEPADTPENLKINFDGPDDGALVFVAGHPGSTDRQLTADQLRTIRDVELPPALLRAAELRGRYIQFATTGDQAARIVADPLFSLENGIKVRRKLLDALHDDAMLRNKEIRDAELREWLFDQPGLAGEIGDPWQRVRDAESAYRAIALDYSMLEAGAAFNSRLFRYARTLVRGATERTKPNTERLPEYADADLPRIAQQMRASVPVYDELETLTLSFSLERMREWLGPDNRLVRELLSEYSPAELASQLVRDSMLEDPEVRMALWQGGIEAINASDDAMILLARQIDDAARDIRTRYENEVEAPVDAATEGIAKARFAAYGTNVYPDATFTLRLNYGTVSGWTENMNWVAPFTRLSRLYERTTGAAPFALPQRWIDRRDRLDMDTPFNLVTTNDIVGGNSGSPLINANGEIVGLIFDGNIHSISGSYWFDTARNRAVAVNTAIMFEALDKIYETDELLLEISGQMD